MAGLVVFLLFLVVWFMVLPRIPGMRGLAEAALRFPGGEVSARKLRPSTQGVNSPTPMFEYACPDCGHVFERLVLSRSSKVPECPRCGRNEVEQVFSAFAMASGKSSVIACAPSGGG